MIKVEQIEVDKFVIILDDDDTDLVVKLSQRFSLDHKELIQTVTTVGLAMFAGLFSMGKNLDDLS